MNANDDNHSNIPLEKDNAEFTIKLLLVIKERLLPFYKNVALGILPHETIDEQHQEIINTVLSDFQLSYDDYKYLLNKFKENNSIIENQGQIKQWLNKIKSPRVPSLFKMHISIEDFYDYFMTKYMVAWYWYKNKYNEIALTKNDSNVEVKYFLFDEIEKAALNTFESDTQQICEHLDIKNKHPQQYPYSLMIKSTYEFILNWDPINAICFDYFHEINNVVKILIQIGLSIGELSQDPLVLSRDQIIQRYHSLSNKAISLRSFTIGRNRLNEGIITNKKLKSLKQILNITAICYKLNITKTCFKYIQFSKQQNKKPFSIKNQLAKIDRISYSIHQVPYCIINELRRFFKHTVIINNEDRIRQSVNEMCQHKYPSIVQNYINMNSLKKLYPIILLTTWYYLYTSVQELDSNSIQKDVIKFHIAMDNKIEENVCKQYGIEFNDSDFIDAKLKVDLSICYAIVNELHYAGQFSVLYEINKAIEKAIFNKIKIPELEVNVIDFTYDQKIANLKSIISSQTYFNHILNCYIYDTNSNNQLNYSVDKINSKADNIELTTLIDILLKVKLNLISHYFQLMKQYQIRKENLNTSAFTKKSYTKVLNQSIIDYNITYSDYEFLFLKYIDHPIVHKLMHQFCIYEEELKAKMPISVIKKYLEFDKFEQIYCELSLINLHTYVTQEIGRVPNAEVLFRSQKPYITEESLLNVINHLNIALVATDTDSLCFMFESTMYYFKLHDSIKDVKIYSFDTLFSKAKLILLEDNEFFKLRKNPLKRSYKRNRKLLNSLYMLVHKRFF